MPRSSALTSSLAALRQAEARLRACAADAAEAGEYEAVLAITHWAQTLRAMLATMARPPSPPAAAPAPTPTAKGKTSPTDPVDPNEALRFLRDADYLVKRARSRKTHTDYEHRAPFEVVKAIAELLKDWRPSRSLMTIEQLTAHPKLGGVAAYQIYVALGWLTQTGLTRRHGRRGYSVPAPEALPEQLQHHWKLLSRA